MLPCAMLRNTQHRFSRNRQAASPMLVHRLARCRCELLRDQQADLRGRLRKLDHKIDNLVEVIAARGAAALASIEDKLREVERDKVIAESELAEVTETLRNLTRNNVDEERVRAVLGETVRLSNLVRIQDLRGSANEATTTAARPNGVRMSERRVRFQAMLDAEPRLTRADLQNAWGARAHG